MPLHIVPLIPSDCTVGVRITWHMIILHFAIISTLVLLIVPMTRSQYYSSGENINTDREEVVCGDKDIRNSRNSFAKLENCTVIEGYLQITLISGGEDYESLSFPKLREITGFFLLFRLVGLKSLSKLFPNLSVIRGTTLFHNYALIIYEMQSLEEIVLPSLTHILRGSVHISKNPQLCYVNTIDWDLIAVAGKGGHYIKDNKDSNQCPYNCPTDVTCPLSKFKGKTTRLCWNQNYCQKVCDPKCGNNSCSDTGACCSPECLGGCTGIGSNNCFVCVGVYYQGKCSKSCPPQTFKYADRRCVTDTECRNLTQELFSSSHKFQTFNWKVHDDNCMKECPSGYMEDENDVHRCRSCGGPCPKLCPGANIDSVASAQLLRGCTHITGALVIQISGSSNVVHELEQNLGFIEEVDHYVKITGTAPLVNLNFLKNLRKIHGQEKNNIDYSLLVIRNPNLQELWDFKNRSKLEIVSGKIFFHLNPMLCVKKIFELKEFANLPKWDERDVSNDSNGDAVACDIRPLRVWHSKSKETIAVIHWDNLRPNYSDYRSLLGYFVSYREAPYQNVSLYEGRDGCGGDPWQVEDVQASNEENATYETYIFKNLKPFTQYAVYVRTYSVGREKLGGQSSILYFSTLPDKPSIPLNLKLVSLHPNEMIITWLPPSQPRGIIIDYKLDINLEKDNQELLDRRNYCTEPFTIPDKPPETAVPKSPNSLDNKITVGKLSKQDIDKLCKANHEKVNLNLEGDAEFKIDFEDFMLNYVFVKRPSQSEKNNTNRNLRERRFTRSINTLPWTDVPMSSATSSTTSKTASELMSTATTNIKGITDTSTKSSLPPPSTTTITVTENRAHVKNLTHFSQYIIEVVACNQGQNNTKLCSEKSLAIARTAPLEGADTIDHKTIVIVTLNDTLGNVRVKWDEPANPNGLIITYQLEYKKTQMTNYSSVPTCITHKQYRQHRGYTFYDLGPGNYSVRIRATSLAGPGNWTVPVYFYIADNSSGLTSGEIAAIAVSVVIFFIILIAGGLWVVVRKKYSQNIPNGVLYASINPEYISTEVYIPDEWEVPREKITICKELGQGSFGMVYAGIAKDVVSGQPEIKCAIKTVNENASVRERIEFLNEASVMKAFSSYHVLKLVGVVSKGQPTLVIMELMGRGDLKAYLRSLRPDAEGEECERQPPTLRRILQMASEIADGMAYLSAKKFVHRDLAARNCMVADDLTVKIGDFGMTRDVYETDYYRKGGKGLLPVRWMAPESLKDGVFTSLSDVWSFGVVLWEMATLASQPYQGLSNEQVLKYVIEGGIMERLEDCPFKLYDLMRRCWQFNSKFRPTFMELVTTLLPYTRSTFRENSFYHSPEAERLLGDIKEAEEASSATPLCSASDEDVDRASGHSRNSATVEVDCEDNDYLNESLRFDPSNITGNDVDENTAGSIDHRTLTANSGNKNTIRPVQNLRHSENKNGRLSNGHLYFQPPKTTEC